MQRFAGLFKKQAETCRAVSAAAGAPAAGALVPADAPAEPAPGGGGGVGESGGGAGESGGGGGSGGDGLVVDRSLKLGASQMDLGRIGRMAATMGLQRNVSFRHVATMTHAIHNSVLSIIGDSDVTFTQLAALAAKHEDDQQIMSLIKSFARLLTVRDSDRSTVEALQRKRKSDGTVVPAVTVARRKQSPVALQCLGSSRRWATTCGSSNQR